jgi:hypothetical protein
MNNAKTLTLTTVNVILLVLLSAPVVGQANTQQTVTIGNTLLSNAHTRVAINDLDKTIQSMNLVKQQIASNNLPLAKTAINKAEKAVSQLYKYGKGTVTENIIVDHGAKMNNSGIIDTGDAYYSPDMWDMRLLKMAQTSLNNGDSDAAYQRLSAVRFPFVTASLMVSTDKTMDVAELVTRELKYSDASDAAFDAKKFTVQAHASASLYDESQSRE